MIVPPALYVRLNREGKKIVEEILSKPVLTLDQLLSFWYETGQFLAEPYCQIKEIKGVPGRLSFLQIPFTFKETFIRESHREENKPQNTHTIDPDKISDEIAKKVTTQIINQFFQPGDLTLNKLNQFSTFMDNSINQAQAKLPKISETQEKILSQEKEFFHAEDYCSAFYNGEPYTFTLAQARALKNFMKHI